jgi:hypothetical protein
MNESLGVIESQLNLGAILTRPRNIIKNNWVERWLREENGIDTERFLEVVKEHGNKVI